MKELRIQLTMTALNAMVQGNELVFDSHDGVVRLFISVDADTVDQFQRQVLMGLLHQLPIGDTKH